MISGRRGFLKAATAAGCLAPLAGISRLSYGADRREKPVLVAIFLRGGADGLHLVGPSADPDYVAARPLELRVADGGDRAGHLLENSFDPASGFRMHHEAAPLARLYEAGRLAVVHAIGLTNGTRSHFVAQELIERGLADEKQIAGTGTGWLARPTSRLKGRVPGYSATPSPALAMRGMSTVLSAPDLSGGLGIPWGASTAELLRSLSMGSTTPAHRATLAALDVFESVDQGIPRESSGRVVPYKPSGNAVYDGAGELSRPLASVARLVKMDVGLAVACIDQGGWDTHEAQPGRFAFQVRHLAAGLAAFQEDMAASGHKTITVVMTEFGRRLRANRSGGTDHGHGGCWLVMGDYVRGGRMFGKWPGLGTAVLDHGVDLAVTTDYRSVLAETLAVCGLSAREGFSSWKAGGYLGVFADRGAE